MTGFRTLGQRTAYRGYATVRIDSVRTPDGGVVEREVVVVDDAVAVVPLLDDRVVLVRQYRQPFGEHQLEIPAGKLDVAGETLEQAAQRELVEEVGYEAGFLERLITIRNSAGWTTERTTIYLGTDLRPAAPAVGYRAAAEEADMEVVEVPLWEALRAVEEGRIEDAKTVVGILLVARRLGT